MEDLEVIELVIDEESDFSGIEAISIVENPAIEEDFIALKEQGRLELAKVDEEKRILMGAALIPNKKIYRNNGLQEYYIFFSKDTVAIISPPPLYGGSLSSHSYFPKRIPTPVGPYILCALNT